MRFFRAVNHEKYIPELKFGAKNGHWLRTISCTLNFFLLKNVLFYSFQKHFYFISMRYFRFLNEKSDGPEREKITFGIFQNK